MIRLLLLLCLSLFTVMMVLGRGGEVPATIAASQTPVSVQPAAMVTPVAYTAGESSLVPTILPLVQPGAVVHQPEAANEPITIRYITAQSVNVREGPSTEFPVVGRLSRGEAARLLWTEENGWAHITLEGDGMTGFISGEFLTDIEP